MVRTGDGGGRHFYLGHHSTVCVFVQCVLLFLQDAYAWIFTNCVLLRIYIFILLHNGIAMRHNRVIGANGLLQPYIEILSGLNSSSE